MTRLGKQLHDFGLKAKLTTTIIFVIILTTIVGSAFFYNKTKIILIDDLKKRGKTTCENLSYRSKYSVFTEEVENLKELIEKAMWAEDMAYVIIQDNAGKTLAEKTTVRLTDAATLKKKALLSKTYEISPIKDSFGNLIYNFSFPIVAKRVSLAEIGGVDSELEEDTQQTRGAVLIGLSLINVTDRLHGILQGIILLTSLIIAGGIAISLWFVKITMKPIVSMAKIADKVAAGDLSQTVEVKSKDEIGTLASQFNAMTAALKQREEQLKESYDELSISEERYRVFIQNSSEGIWCFEPQDKKPYPADISENELIDWMLTKSTVVECNEAMAMMHGLKKREEFLNTPLSDIMSKSNPRNIEHLRNFIRNNYRLVDFKTEELNSDGSVHIMSNCLIGTVNDKHLLRIWGIQRDITETQRAEQIQMGLFAKVQEVNQELKEFAHIASHNLKAPLRAIKTLAEWLSSDYADKLDENGRKQMQLLLGRVDRMHNLVNGILQYSRIGSVKEKQATVNLNKVVSDVIDMIAPPPNIKITVEEKLPEIRCETTRIMQVFQNLLSNAVKYMDKPQGIIKISCADEGRFWKFAVADNGPGIEEKHFDKIFRLFQTLSPRDKFESTGIGLTVVKKIVELYGGNVWVESKIGEGSTFYFTLPKQEVEIKNARLYANTVS